MGLNRNDLLGTHMTMTHDQAAAAEQSPGETLNLASERLKSVLELSSEWYWEQDESYRFTLIFGAAFGQTGLDPQQSLGTTRWDHNAVPVGENASWEPHKALLEAHQPFADFVFRRVGPQGEMRYMSTSGQPVFEAGRFTGYRGIGTSLQVSARSSCCGSSTWSHAASRAPRVHQPR